MITKVLNIAGLALSTLCIVSLTSAADRPLRHAQDRPNIIYILADDLGYNELGCYGQKKIKTPNIDRIAAEGIKLTQHYSGQAVCAPSRCAFLTGKHMGHAYIRNNKELPKEGQTPIPADTVTISKLLKGQGYATACVGKWGLGYPGSEGDPNNQGFDLFFGYNCQRHAHHFYRNYLWKNQEKVMYPDNKTVTGPNYSADEMRKEALQFVREKKDQPFFLYWATPIPHVSLQVPEESLKQYLGKWPEKPFKGAKKVGHGYSGHPTPRAAYAAMISHMDRNIGQLMDLLDELKLTDNTLLIFTSDNGATYTGGVDAKFFNSVGPLKGLKGSLYEGGIRVPFVAKWPKHIKPGTTSDHMSAFWDMMPTFADVAGYRAPENIDGISLLPSLTGTGKQPAHPFLYWEFIGAHHNRKERGQVAVRMGDWKAMRTDLKKDHKAPIKLYNLKTDIGETKNVAEAFPEVVQKIRSIMINQHKTSKVFPFPALDK